MSQEGLLDLYESRGKMVVSEDAPVPNGGAGEGGGHA